MYDLELLEATFLVEQEPPKQGDTLARPSGSGSYGRRLASLLQAKSGRYEACLNGVHQYGSDSEASMAVVDAMVARHFTDGEIWQTLEGSGLYARRVEKKGEAHTRELYAGEIEKARAEVPLFEHDPGLEPEHTRKLEAEEDDAKELPQIVVTDRHMRDIAFDAWSALNRSNVPPHIFQHGSGIADIHYEEEDRRYVLRHLEAPVLKGMLDRCADWLKQTRKGLVPARPPTDVIQDMLSGIKPLPLIKGIVGTPVVSAEGLIVTAPGYQPETGLYYSPDGLLVSPVTAVPSREELTRAVQLIRFEWLGEFPFVDEASLANTIATAVTPLVREIITGPTPLSIFDAPAPGTGKGLLSETLVTIVCGTSPGVMNDTRSEDEIRKRVTSLLKEGTAAALIDNIKHEINSSTLAALLTSVIWVDRQLGDNSVLRLRNRALWMATGNNIKLSNEMARRSVSIRLDSRVDRPWEREGFRHPQLGVWVRAHRHELVWALLTMIQNWLAQGKSQWSGKSLGSFESWSETVGGILEAAGIEGFMANRDELYRRADTETEEWRSFVAAWWEQHQQTPVRTADLVPLIRDEGHLATLMGRVKDGASERSYSTRLGTALSAARDRRFGRHFIRHVGADGHAKVSMYRLEPVEDAGPSSREAQGPAKVPHAKDAISDSNAGPAGPAGPQTLFDSKIAQRTPNEPKKQTRVQEAIKVTQVTQVPQSDSETQAQAAGPVPDGTAEVPHEVPQESWMEVVDE